MPYTRGSRVPASLIHMLTMYIFSRSLLTGTGAMPAELIIGVDILERVTEVAQPRDEHVEGLGEHSRGSRISALFASDMPNEVFLRVPAVCAGRAAREGAMQQRFLRTGDIYVLV